MSYAGCDELAADIAELALGTLTGRERALAIAHVDGCDTCRRRLDLLAGTADMLLLISPEAELPAGVKDRILARIDRGDHRRSRAARFVSVAAAVALVVAAVGATTYSIGARTRPAREAVSSAQGLDVAEFVPSPGEGVTGRVLSPQGGEAWLFMVVHDTTPSETYTCRLLLTNGRHVTIGSFQLHDGVGVWGHTLTVRPREIRSVQLLGSDGDVAATATIR